MTFRTLDSLDAFIPFVTWPVVPELSQRAFSLTSSNPTNLVHTGAGTLSGPDSRKRVTGSSAPERLPSRKCPVAPASRFREGFGDALPPVGIALGSAMPFAG